MTAIDEVNEARVEAEKVLANELWFEGVSVVRTMAGYALRISVTEAEHLALVPGNIAGFRTRPHEVGRVRTFGGEEHAHEHPNGDTITHTHPAGKEEHRHDFQRHHRDERLWAEAEEEIKRETQSGRSGKALGWDTWDEDMVNARYLEKIGQKFGEEDAETTKNLIVDRFTGFGDFVGVHLGPHGNIGWEVVVLRRSGGVHRGDDYESLLPYEINGVTIRYQPLPLFTPLF